MKLFGRKVTSIEKVQIYENIEDFMEAVNKLAESKEWFQVGTATHMDDDGFSYTITTVEKIK